MKSMLRRATYLALGILTLLFTLAPSISSASTQATVEGLLPPNTTSCPTVGVSQITPYVYDGHLDSFDITITDASYVAIGGSVGDTPVDFHYMTRSYTSDGALRIHVDIASTPINETSPLKVTLLSSRPDTQMTCALSIRGDVTGTPDAQGVPEIPTTPVYPTQPPVRNTHGGAHRSKDAGPTGNMMGTTSSTSTVAQPRDNTVFVGALSALGTVCSKSSSWKLWTILLVLYGLFVIVLSMQSTEQESPHSWNTALILALLAALLGLWYLSATCRAGPWAPIIALLIAIGGIWLIGGHDDARQMKLLLPENKK